MDEAVVPQCSSKITPETICVIGPGAVGLLTAARLQLAGIPVTLLDHRPERAQRLRHITLQDSGQTYTLQMNTTADPSCIAHHTHVLICVKAHATTKVAATIAPYLNQSTAILSLQNGLTNHVQLAQLPCRENVRIAITSYGAYLEDEKTVHLTGNGMIQIAAQSHDLIAKCWMELFQRAGFRVERAANADAMIWSKLIINAALNPVTALYGIPNGTLPGHTLAWQQACSILHETATIAQSIGVEIDTTHIEQQLLMVCRQTAQNHSSMLVDIQNGKQTEIDAINGAIVQTAQLHGLDTPHNRAIMKKINAITKIQHS